MKLLSHDGERLVFLLSLREVKSMRHLVALGAAAHRGTVRLSHAPEALPPSAVEDFNAAIALQQRANREFLQQLFSPTSAQLTAPTRGRRGFGLTLSRAEVERFLQALNEIKLAHWEYLGCPEFEVDEIPEVHPTNFPSMWLMDAVNELQMLFLRALASPD